MEEKEVKEDSRGFERLEIILTREARGRRGFKCIDVQGKKLVELPVELPNLFLICPKIVYG